MKLKTGLLITLEGGEGSGKSTQIKKLADTLRDDGYDIVVTREPGGTAEAEKIRNLLVHRDGGNWTPVAECLLLFAARVMHVENLIKPSMDKGCIVICDRFADSTRAYQGYGHGLPLETVEDIYRVALGSFKPDLTFILDLPVEAGLARAGKRLDADQSGEDRFEQMGLKFHERMRQGYLEIAQADPQRCRVIDASGPPDSITANILQHLRAFLDDRNGQQGAQHV